MESAGSGGAASRPGQPLVSVIVPARNAAGTLGDCLDALQDQLAGLASGELLVVDDGSTDASGSIARERRATVVRLGGRGPAAARNAGARAARGELLIFIDADCLPLAGCLAALVRAFDDPSVAGVRGAYAGPQRSAVARFTQLELEEKQERMAASRQVAVIDTACAAYRREVFCRNSGFDERFPSTSAEDVELSFRLAAAGARLLFVPEARVLHHHADRLGRYAWRKLRFGYFRARLYRRYPARLREDGYTPRLMPVQIGLALAGLAFGLLSVRQRFARPPTLGAWLGFLLSTLPLTWRAWQTDRQLLPLVPLLLLVRALTLGGGLALGTLGLLAELVPLLAARRPLCGR
jgi:glycosyltransferase involved in cell wall biosynthesis